MNKNKHKVIVGSQNPVKVNAVKTALESVFPDIEFAVTGVNAPSNVADQPMTSDETLLGAENRVAFIEQQFEADWHVAIEGGIDNFAYGPATFAYIVIAHQGQKQVGRSANLPLPNVVYQALQTGEELGHVMDRLFNTDNIKQKGGAMALLTKGVVTRESVYTLALTTALAPFVNSELFNQ
jgi:inosine/xanthosine triphosphatase